MIYRLAFNTLSVIALLILMYACAMELPRAMDKEEAAYQARVTARCVVHGDYNMADAFCAAAMKEKGQ